MFKERRANASNYELNVFVSMYVYIHIYVCIYVLCEYVYVLVYMYVCVYILMYSYIFHLTLYIANISIIILTKSIIDYLARVTPSYIFVTYSHRKNDYKNLS